jgi:hypothetical protein
LQKRNNWESRKNSFSGANNLYEEEVGKYDIRAWGVGPLRRIFLQIECKTTTNSEDHSIKREWFEKLDFSNDEYTVFSYKNHRTNYTALPISVYKLLFSTEELPEAAQKLTVALSRGEDSITVKKSILEKTTYFLFQFKGSETYMIFDLAILLDRIEKRGYQSERFEKMTMLEKLKVVNEFEDLTQFYKENKDKMTPREKRVYWQKVERLMNESHDKDVYEMLEATYGWVSHELRCPKCDHRFRTMRV